MKATERLISIVAPPAVATSASGDFAAIETELATRLPSDYKELVRRYGYGTFCDFLNLWSPFFTACTMMSEARNVLDADRQLARTAPNAVPFVPFPERDGALPWARSDNGDVAYWLTWGVPEEWPVAIWNPRSGQNYDLVEGGATAFLVAWISGETSFKRFAKPDVACFDPWRERAFETISLSAAATPFDVRLQALLESFAPTEMRGTYEGDDSSARQVHFVAQGGAIRVTYDTVYGHNVRLAAPADRMETERARVERAVASMGCSVTKITRR